MRYRAVRARKRESVGCYLTSSFSRRRLLEVRGCLTPRELAQVRAANARSWAQARRVNTGGVGEGAMTTRSAARIRASRVLFVDGCPERRRRYAEVARDAGLHAETAENGQEAFAHAILWVPDVVVAAVDLGGIDGYELCRCLHWNPMTQPTGVILVADHATDAVAQAARECSCDALVIDPSPFELIEPVIARVVRERRARLAHGRRRV